MEELDTEGAQSFPEIFISTLINERLSENFEESQPQNFKILIHVKNELIGQSDQLK